METLTKPTDLKPRFGDNFLQDRNIKWILGIGTAIFLGSSLMLVSSQWSGYSAALKQAIILAYTAGIYAAGRYGYEHLVLRRTGTVLLTLALLLAPVACAALPWVWQAGTGTPIYFALLAASGLLTAVIGQRTLGHFFRSPQPTLTAAYLILSLAAAIVPLSPATRSPWMALALWLVFAAGTIKANRSVFWLLEERQQPRAFGFLPMILLGAQFLGLFVAYFARQMTLDWIGLGCVLTAVPILLAADAVARVFQQRTGNLVWPLPWSVLTPLAMGLLLCVVGVCLSGVDLLSRHDPYALVPTAAVAAGLMALVARRTGQRAFVWAMLVLLTVAYRFLPVFFAETARLAVESTAAAIHEARLPWAYYGFTFLPLLAALTAAAAWTERRGNTLFAAPMRQFAVALALLLLGIAPTHTKALFPAALALTGALAAQTAVFRNRLLALPAVVGWLLAAIGFPAFFNGVAASWLGPNAASVALPASARFNFALLASAALLAPGIWIDRRLSRLPARLAGEELSGAACAELDHVCRHASLIATLLLMAVWTTAQRLPVPGLEVAALLAGLAVAHALICLQPLVSLAAVTFANLVLAIALHDHSTGWLQFLTLETCVLLAQWLGSCLLQARPTWHISQAFAWATREATVFVLTSAWLLIYLPLHVLHAAGCHLQPHELLWPATVLMLAWTVAAAWREASKFLGILAVGGLLVIASSLAVSIGGGAALSWLPTVITLVAAALVPAAAFLRRRGESWSALVWAIDSVVPVLLGSIAIVSLGFFTWPMFVAGSLASIALSICLAERRQPLALTFPLILLNWRLIGLVVIIATPRFEHFLQILEFGLGDLCLPLSLAAAVSVVFWSWVFPSRTLEPPAPDLDLPCPQRFILRGSIAFLLARGLILPALPAGGFALAAGTFALLVADELVLACRQQNQHRVWVAEAIGAVALVYFAWFHILVFGHGLAMFVVLFAGLALWLTGHVLRDHPTLAIMTGPFQLTGRALPLATVGLAIYRHVWHLEMLGHAPQWLGHNSLALLMAAAFYFWQALEGRRKDLIFLAATILNVALVLLWRELRLTDPQFYMMPIGISILCLVELFEREIPAEHQNPLRYVGALVILVSPTFHIVHGSWVHMFALMLAAVAVALVSIGLRTRALLYTGAAFLAADIMAMIVRGSVDHPQLLWVAGLLLGAGVLTLGAVCELERQRVLQRVRAVAATLESWK